MLICPQCQSENPNNNKYCEKCGASLRVKACESCGAEVLVSAQHCESCGASTGTFWWATIFPKSAAVQEQPPTSPTAATQVTLLLTEPEELEEPLPEVLEAEILPVMEVAESEAETTPEQALEVPPLPSSEPDEEESGESTAIHYLDSQQRYRVLEMFPGNETVDRFTQARVLDCQPLQESPLNSLEPPAIAQPYLSLQESFAEAIPSIHDAWESEDNSFILIEDRSQWFQLLDFWQNEQVPILQILRSLDDMAKLWAELEPLQMRQSLLEVTNLRLDEDQSLSLQQLYPEPEGAQITLQDLGKVWQSLFEESQRTQFLALIQLLQNLVDGKIETIAQLREHLQAIAQEVQPDLDAPPASPDIDATEAPEEFSMTEQNSNPEPVSGTESPTMPDLGSFERESSESDDLPTIVLPKQLIRLDDVGATHTGRQRPHNEDSFAINTKLDKQETPKGKLLQARGLYILCDGMGGHASGEVASAMAVESLKRYFAANWTDQLPNESSIREAVNLANKELFETNQGSASSGSGRMGTTLVMALLQDTRIAIAHVGDSRLYRLTRKRGLEQVTTDHEVGQREIQRGVEPAIAYSRPDAYQLTQALGPRDNNFIHPDVQFINLDEDTLFILCSDGLSDNDLLETHWQSHLAPLLSSRASLEQGVNQLIDLANEYNGHDNITAILLRAKLRANFDQYQRL